MTNGFTKLFNSIITSSIWSESSQTRVMWVTFLATSDADGFVTGSIPGMAALARMSLAEAEQSIKTLISPDPYSRSKDYEGRRLLECEGGWLIANYAKYRQKRDPEKRREQNREAQQRFRDKQIVSQSKPEISRGQPKQRQRQRHTHKKITTFSQNSEEFRLAKLLLDFILERYPDYKDKDLQKWAVHIDRMIRLDNRSPDRIEEIIRWCQQDDFWQNNILSTAKLRKQFDQLYLKSRGQDEHRKTNRPVSTGRLR